MSEKSLVFAGGGTAGHIFPLVAVAEAYKTLHPEVRRIYLGSEGDHEWLPEGVFDEIHAIEAGKFHRFLTFDLFRQPGKAWRGYQKAKAILREANAVAVLCKGGYASLPTAYAARRLKIQVYAHETDLFPGLANRKIAAFAQIIFTAFPVENYATILDVKKLVEVGQPVRTSFFSQDALPEDVMSFSLHSPYILVTGGSQGALRLNTIVSDCWEEISAEYRVFHITGAGDFERMAKMLKSAKPEVQDRVMIQGHITEGMADLMRGASFVIMRGGGTFWEAMAAKVRMILVPLSSSASNHQQLNVEYLVKKGLAIMVSESDHDAKMKMLTAVSQVHDVKVIDMPQDSAEKIAKLLP